MRAPRQESLQIRDPFTDHDAVGGDLKEAQVLAVVAPAEFHDGHHPLQLARRPRHTAAG